MDVPVVTGQIIERSPICCKIVSLNVVDSKMADRGIFVQDLFASKGVKVNTPAI